MNKKIAKWSTLKKYSTKAASDAYKNGDVKFDINSNRCALLVIDMQDWICETRVDIIVDTGSNQTSA